MMWLCRRWQSHTVIEINAVNIDELTTLQPVRVTEMHKLFLNLKQRRCVVPSLSVFLFPNNSHTHAQEKTHLCSFPQINYEEQTVCFRFSRWKTKRWKNVSVSLLKAKTSVCSAKHQHICRTVALRRKDFFFFFLFVSVCQLSPESFPNFIR